MRHKLAALQDCYLHNFHGIIKGQERLLRLSSFVLLLAPAREVLPAMSSALPTTKTPLPERQLYPHLHLGFTLVHN